MGRSRGNFHHADEDPNQRFLSFNFSSSYLYLIILNDFSPWSKCNSRCKRTDDNYN